MKFNKIENSCIFWEGEKISIWVEEIGINNIETLKQSISDAEYDGKQICKKKEGKSNILCR